MQDIYITVNITEGPKYSVSEVKLAGELLVPENELRKLIKIAPGEVFSREHLTESSSSLPTGWAMTATLLRMSTHRRNLIRKNTGRVYVFYRSGTSGLCEAYQHNGQ